MLLGLPLAFVMIAGRRSSPWARAITAKDSLAYVSGAAASITTVVTIAISSPEARRAPPGAATRARSIG
jgi:hypothetical protein